MAYTTLSSDIYKFRQMAENREQHTRDDILSAMDQLDSTQLGLWSFVSALGEIMAYTSDNRHAWTDSNIHHIGEGLAAVADIAIGIEETKSQLLHSRAVQGGAA